MITFHWAMQYTAVLCGYIFLLFVWPRVVFDKHLSEKSKIYQFSFCVTVQIVLVNTVVLVFGLVHILNRWTIMLFFYGVFLAAILYKYNINVQYIQKTVEHIRYLVTGTYGKKYLVVQGMHGLGRGLEKGRTGLWTILRPHLGEYIVLGGLLIYGVIYFSYGAFQHYSYGYGDGYVHHSWIYGLTEGKIFADGVYPEAMHCFIYCLQVLLGISVSSSLMFLGGIHMVTFLLAVYSFLREVAHWRYTPFLVLALFLTLDSVSMGEVFGMSRFQWCLPQEFGMHSQFLCVVYLSRYLKHSHFIKRKGKTSKFYWDENLLIFAMAIAVSISTHFYVTVMAFLLCLSFALFAVRRIFNRKRFVPLCAAVLCGLILAILPMAGALAIGIPFQGSIGWAVSIMNGTDGGEGRIQHIEEDKQKASEEANIAKRGIHLAEKALKTMYIDGYQVLYASERAKWIVGLTGAAAAMWLAFRLLTVVLRRYTRRQIDGSCFDNFPGVIFASVLFMFVYAAPLMGLPELIAGARLCSTEQLLILTVIVLPADMLFSLMALYCRDNILQVISICCVLGIYISTNMLGVYHGYLFYELTRYNEVVMTTTSIVQTLPKSSYTIVAPTDELYSIAKHGYHEELLTFVEKSEGEEYILPTRYVFIYIEKRPLDYAQYHFLKGPSWLAQEKYQNFYYPERSSQCPEIRSSEISKEAIEKDWKYSKEWDAYKMLGNRTIMQSKAYEWCQKFSRLYPSELKTYYEDENFVCYYFGQELNSPYNLAIT